ncbi:MAG: GMC family oxidoreductase [Bdellovibrionota bacterium]
MNHEADILSPSQRELALSFFRAILPPGRMLPGAGERTVRAFESILADSSPGLVKLLGRVFPLLDRAAILGAGKPFSRLAPPKQEELLQKLARDPLAGKVISLVAALVKTSHFDHEEVYQAAGIQYQKGGPAEPARWLSQVFDGASVEDGEEIECDAVVVGTGAGGGVVGTELALRGYAVIFLEEGKFYRRDSFTGSFRDSHKKFYREEGAAFSRGNNMIPILMGRLVGGGTAINTGVSYRTPDRVLKRWCEWIGTDELSPERMRPYFEKVERELRVVEVDGKFLSGVARVTARGCDKLGWHHYVLTRNAPDCQGDGVCDFGCPSAARRSVEISYLPQALERGSMLYTEMHAERVRTENGKAVGVVARNPATGKTLWIRSRVTILAGGAVPTPIFLLNQGICNSSGLVGKMLSVHPSTGCSAIFDEPIEQEAFVPNTRSCDEFFDQGILLQSGHPSLNMMPLTLPLVGRPLMDAMERYRNIAGFGCMIEDVERQGSVSPGPSGKANIRYSLTPTNVKKLHEGLCRVAEMWLAAGAERCFPLIFRFPEIKTKADLDKFRKLDLKAWEFLLTSWHPLGTCEMGWDAKTSVVSPDHETHDVKNLFITDSSTVPGAIGVNPQITIMGMATRASEKIALRLEGNN